MNIKKDIIVLTGAGQLGMAIVRRMGYGNKIFVADWKLENAQAIAKTLTEAGFDVIPIEVDISSKESVLKLIEAAQKEGEISMFINAAGVSPSQASIEQI
jgi:NADP-dependent 3-hydroxy acid dehydrogenase YdfG